MYQYNIFGHGKLSWEHKENLANNRSIGAINIKMVILETQIMIHKIFANWILWF